MEYRPSWTTCNCCSCSKSRFISSIWVRLRSCILFIAPRNPVGACVEPLFSDVSLSCSLFSPLDAGLGLDDLDDDDWVDVELALALELLAVAEDSCLMAAVALLDDFAFALLLPTIVGGELNRAIPTSDCFSAATLLREKEIIRRKRQNIEGKIIEGKILEGKI